MRVAVSEDLQSFGAVTIVKTKNDFKKSVASLITSATNLAQDEVRGIICAVPAVCNDEQTVFVRTDDAGLSSWVEEPLAKMLQQALKTKVWLQNSTALSGLGEAYFGAGQGYNIIAYHNIGSVVTGVKIENGVIDSAAFSFEPGDQILDIDQTILGNDIEATLENLVSTHALQSRTGEKPENIPQSDIVWEQLAEYLAYGLRNTITYWSPDVIVLGGDMIMGEPKITIDAVSRHLYEIAGEIQVPDIVDVDLHEDAVLYGAMAFLNQKI